MMKWMPIYKANLHLDDYAVRGYRLCDTEYYGLDGMDERASVYPQDTWRLEILSWYKIGKDKFAGCNSPVKLCMEFTEKDSANKCWKAIKDAQPCFEILEAMGFKKEV